MEISMSDDDSLTDKIQVSGGTVLVLFALTVGFWAFMKGILSMQLLAYLTEIAAEGFQNINEGLAFLQPVKA